MSGSVYQFVAEHPGCWLGVSQVEVRLPRLHVPRRYCPECRSRPGVYSSDIPRPIPQALAHHLEPYQDDGSDIYMPLLLKAHDEGEETQAIAEAFDRHNALHPDEFGAVAGLIRETLKLEEGYLIEPQASLGPATVRVNKPMAVDIVAGVLYQPCPLLSERAAEALESSGLQGIAIRPLCNRKQNAQLLYTMEFLETLPHPEIVSGDCTWCACGTCGELWLAGPANATLGVQAGCAEECDFYCLQGMAWPYLSARALTWLEGSGLKLELKCEDLRRQYHAPQTDRL